MVTGIRHASKLSDSRMVVTRTQAPCKSRQAYVIQGVTHDDRLLCINDPDVGTLATALLERMFKCKVGGEFVEPPTPNRDHLFVTLKYFKQQLLRSTKWTPKVSPEQFVQMYQGRKRTLYENCLSEFYATGVTKKHAVSCPFVKCEKCRPGSAPRCIQPRKAPYNVGIGVYLKPNEHCVYHAISKVFGDSTIVVMKGVNVCQIAVALRAKWDSFGDPACVGLDATKFDMHVSRTMLEWEHSIYLILSGNCKELRRLLRMQLDNTGVAFCQDGKLRYKVSGRRFSGDMNTALGNCIIMCAMVYSYAREKLISIKLGNNGDDCVVFMERKDVSAFTSGLDEWFMRLGFRMTVEPPVYRFADVEFCQMHPIYTLQGWTMVRNFQVAREKDSLSIIPLSSEKIFRKWIHAVGEGGLALTSGVPVFQSMYQCYIRNGVPSNIGKSPAMASGARFMSVGMEARVMEIIPLARVTFFEAWGVTPDEQVVLEEYFSSLVLQYGCRAIDIFTEYQNSPL